MARLLWLPDVLAGADLTVHEVIGWERRGADTFGPVRGITCHATAGSRNSTDAGEIHTLLNGSSSAPPPIAQLYLSRTGDWHVIASGTCYHNKVGWAGPNEGYGNDNLLGIEAQNDNKGEPWSAHMLDSYQRGVAALCRKLGIPASRVAAHREHQPGAKTDPHGINMTTFRARVSALLAGEDNDVGTLEGQQATQLKDAHFVLTSVPMTDGTRAPAHVVLGALVEDNVELKATVKSLAEYVKVLADRVAELQERPPVVVDQAMIEAALRKVLGSVDGASPQA